MRHRIDRDDAPAEDHLHLALGQKAGDRMSSRSNTFSPAR